VYEPSCNVGVLYRLSQFKLNGGRPDRTLNEWAIVWLIPHIWGLDYLLKVEAVEQVERDLALLPQGAHYIREQQWCTFFGRISRERLHRWVLCQYCRYRCVEVGPTIPEMLDLLPCIIAIPCPQGTRRMTLASGVQSLVGSLGTSRSLYEHYIIILLECDV
jgi:hypothetical protein